MGNIWWSQMIFHQRWPQHDKMWNLKKIMYLLLNWLPSIFNFFSFSHIPTPILVADMWSPTFIVNWSFLLSRFEISYYISAINSISLNFLSKSINTLFAAKVFRKSEPGDVEKPEQRPPHHHRPAAALRHVRVRGFQSCRVHQKIF